MTRIPRAVSVLCAILALVGASSRAQTEKPVTGHVVDTQSQPISGARIMAKDGSVLAVTDLAGRFTLPANTTAIEVTAPGFSPATVTINGPIPPEITLQPVAETQSVSVTAYLSPVGLLDSPASTRNLTTTELNESASPVLDDKIRQIPGAELFGVRARWSPTQHPKASLCAAWVPPPPAGLSF